MGLSDMAEAQADLASMTTEVDPTRVLRENIQLRVWGAWLDSAQDVIYTDLDAASRAAKEAVDLAAPTTAVQDRLVLSEDEVRQYLGLAAGDTTFDWLLDILNPAARRAADDYLHNAFLDADGTELPIPDTVKLGVMAWIKVEFERRRTTGSGEVTSERAGELAKSYAWSNTAGFDPASLPPGVLRLWRLYRLLPGL